MTIDEAIKHCLDIADGQDKCAEISVSEHAKERISQCAADHRQLAEWLTELKELRELNDKIYDVLAKQFGSPCNCDYAIDDYMRKNGGCDDCGVEIPAKECWCRYIQTKLTGGMKMDDYISKEKADRRNERMKMDDYISKEKAIKELREVYENEYPTASGDFDEYASHDVPNVLRNIPSADVQPVKHGHWIKETFDYSRCSICGEIRHPSNFCPE